MRSPGVAGANGRWSSLSPRGLFGRAERPVCVVVQAVNWGQSRKKSLDETRRFFARNPVELWITYVGADPSMVRFTSDCRWHLFFDAWHGVGAVCGGWQDSNVRLARSRNCDPSPQWSVGGRKTQPECRKRRKEGEGEGLHIRPSEAPEERGGGVRSPGVGTPG